MALQKPNKTLIDAVIATSAGSFTYTIPLQHSALVTAGLLEVNATIVDPNGKGLATRATQAGIDQVTAYNAEQSGTQTNTTAPKTAKLEFVIEDGFVPQVKKRGNTGGNTQYPFDQLQVGQSFFVPNSEKYPDVAKSLASTVSSAIARYEIAVPGQTRTNRKGDVVPLTEKTRIFVINRETNGARIGRTK